MSREQDQLFGDLFEIKDGIQGETSLPASSSFDELAMIKSTRHGERKSRAESGSLGSEEPQRIAEIEGESSLLRESSSISEGAKTYESGDAVISGEQSRQEEADSTDERLPLQSTDEQQQKESGDLCLSTDQEEADILSKFSESENDANFDESQFGDLEPEGSFIGGYQPTRLRRSLSYDDAGVLIEKMDTKSVALKPPSRSLSRNRKPRRIYKWPRRLSMNDEDHQGGNESISNERDTSGWRYMWKTGRGDIYQ